MYTCSAMHKLHTFRTMHNKTAHICTWCRVMKNSNLVPLCSTLFIITQRRNNLTLTNMEHLRTNAYCGARNTTCLCHQYNVHGLSTCQCTTQAGKCWHCSRKSCNGCASVCQKSWFSSSKLSIAKILALTYAYAQKFTVTQAVHETSLDNETTSSETGRDFYNYCQEVSVYKIMKHHMGPIGSKSTTVEIDESNFRKLKYHHCHYFEGQLLFSGLCHETKACFLVPVECWDKDTLLPNKCTQTLL